MAVVISMQRDERTRFRRHPTETECRYFVRTYAGGKVLQLSTSGSTDREVRGQTSQTMQFDEHAAKQLFDILKVEFGF
jgi:hypothetical protein